LRIGRFFLQFLFFGVACGERGGGKMSLSFVQELQAQVERLEKEVLDAKAPGKDSGGDRVALSHLKALIEHFRGQVKNS
jgi:hypothetical protein